jgi:murein DD-endopeptidase MepM/ murein hydrolase activator NlpD
MEYGIYFSGVMMKLKFIFTVALITGINFAFAQEQHEELEVLGGPISDAEVIATDNPVVEEAAFDGILNPELHKLVVDTYGFRNHWWTETCFSLDNDINSITEELWICLEDEQHSGFHMPVTGKVMSSFKMRGYRMHKGWDMDLKTGDTVYAAFSGRIRYSTYNKGGYGNLVIIRHYNGIETYYAHLSKMLVGVDEYVEAGQPIGLGGSTGRSTGPHLHFECRFYDNAFDPEAIIDLETGQLKDVNLIITKKIFQEPSGQEKILAMRSAGTSNPVGSAPPASGSGVYYKVRSGDSLWAIANRHGTTVNKICQLNGISEKKVLQIGMTLRVK